MPFELVLYVLLVPLVLGTVTALLERPLGLTAGTAWLAAVLAFFVAGGGIRGWPEVPPAESGDWLLLAAAVVGIYAILSALIPWLQSWWFRALALVVLLFFPLVPLLLREPWTAALSLAVVGLSALVVWGGTHLTQRQAHPSFVVAFWALCLAGGGIAVAIPASFVAGSIGIATAVSLLPLIGLFMFGEPRGMVRLNGTLVLLSALLWFYTFLYVPYEWFALLLIGLAPVLMILVILPAFGSRRFLAMGVAVLLAGCMVAGGYWYNQQGHELIWGEDDDVYMPYSSAITPPGYEGNSLPGKTAFRI